MIEGVTSSFTFSTASITGANGTVANALALATTANSVVLINLTGATQTNLDVATYTAGDDLMIVNVGGARSVYYIDGAVTPTIDFANDFLTYAA